MQSAALRAKLAQDAELTAKWEAAQDAKIEKWIYIWGWGRKHCKGKKACEELKEEAKKSEIEYKKKKEAEAAAAAEREKRFKAWFEANARYGGALQSLCTGRKIDNVCMQTARAAFDLIDSHPGEYSIAASDPTFETIWKWGNVPFDAAKAEYRVTEVGIRLTRKGAGECYTHQIDTEGYPRPGACPDSEQLKKYYEPGSTCTCLARREI